MDTLHIEPHVTLSNHDKGAKYTLVQSFSALQCRQLQQSLVQGSAVIM